MSDMWCPTTETEAAQQHSVPGLLSQPISSLVDFIAVSVQSKSIAVPVISCVHMAVSL